MPRPRGESPQIVNTTAKLGGDNRQKQDEDGPSAEQKGCEPMGRFTKKQPDKKRGPAETQRRADKERRKAAKAERKAAARELLRDARVRRADPGTGPPL